MFNIHNYLRISRLSHLTHNDLIENAVNKDCSVIIAGFSWSEALRNPDIAHFFYRSGLGDFQQDAYSPSSLAHIEKVKVDIRKDEIDADCKDYRPPIITCPG